MQVHDGCKSVPLGVSSAGASNRSLECIASLRKILIKVVTWCARREEYDTVLGRDTSCNRDSLVNICGSIYREARRHVCAGTQIFDSGAYQGTRVRKCNNGVKVV